MTHRTVQDCTPVRAFQLPQLLVALLSFRFSHFQRLGQATMTGSS